MSALAGRLAVGEFSPSSEIAAGEYRAGDMGRLLRDGDGEPCGGMGNPNDWRTGDIIGPTAGSRGSIDFCLPCRGLPDASMCRSSFVGEAASSSDIISSRFSRLTFAVSAAVMFCWVHSRSHSSSWTRKSLASSSCSKVRRRARRPTSIFWWRSASSEMRCSYILSQSASSCCCRFVSILSCRIFADCSRATSGELRSARAVSSSASRWSTYWRMSPLVDRRGLPILERSLRDLGGLAVEATRGDDEVSTSSDGSFAFGVKKLLDVTRGRAVFGRRTVDELTISCRMALDLRMWPKLSLLPMLPSRFLSMWISNPATLLVGGDTFSVSEKCDSMLPDSLRVRGSGVELRDGRIVAWRM